MALFSGLESLGLGKMNEKQLFKQEEANNTAKEKKQVEEQAPKPVAKKVETDILYNKKYTCPICGKEFISKAILASKNKMVERDRDLRQKFDLADPNKYEPIVCGSCGFGALSKFFVAVTPLQGKAIRENISANFKGLKEPEGETYSYDDAIVRYKLVLASTMVKNAKNSEKAYVCLRMAWTYRGKAETLPEDTPNREAVLKELHDTEIECLTHAYEGFSSAFSKESFPMCGMDEHTVTYIVAELARRIGKLEESKKWVSRLLVSRTASDRVKDMARDIKELIDKEEKK